MGTPAFVQPSPAPHEAMRCDLSRHLVRLSEKGRVRCVGTQVSRSQLRLVSFDELAPQSKLHLRLKGRDIPLEVLTCRCDDYKPSVYHIQLLVSDPLCDLQQVMEAAGLFGSKEHKSLRVGDSEISLHAIRAALNAARPVDSSVAAAVGGKLGDGPQKGFPLQVDGQSLMAFVPSDIAPAALQAMHDDEFSARITLFLRKRSSFGDSRWIKAWPLVA